MDEWKLADAKNKLSEVIDKANADGAQVITRHGRKVAYVVAANEFDRLRQKKSGRTMADLFAGAPTDDAFADIMEEIVASRPKTFDKPNPFDEN